MTTIPDLRWPVDGKFGPYGGRFVPETLSGALADLEAAFLAAVRDDAFCARLRSELRDYAGRPTPITECPRLGAAVANATVGAHGVRPGGARIILKREDLCHTGAHKINNTIGQGLLCQWLGKTRVIAETGAGQHGVATATVCARLGLDCTVYMGTEDIERQAPNVGRMRLLGAKVEPVSVGTRTLKDATTAALQDWVTNVESTFYILGSAVGPHPYPAMVRYFQRVIGDEARAQMLDQYGRLPDRAYACVGGGSNAIGLFAGFLDDADVALIGVEAGGRSDALGEHAATLVYGRPGVMHGAYSYLLQDADGQVVTTHSISAGLDYPGVGPEHAYLRDTGRARYVSVTDAQALDALSRLARYEGILCALESAHALAQALADAPTLGPDALLLVNCSGRGDKDLKTLLELL